MGELIERTWHAGGTLRRGFPLHQLLKRPFFGRSRPWRWPRGVPSALYQRADITSPSGGRLAALIRPTDATQSNGVIICAHPMGVAAKGFWIKYGHVDEFAARGFNVVTFDFNGFGESDSTNFDYSGDLIAVARYARRVFAGQRIVVVGASFGAMRALEAAAREPSLFDAVIAEAAAPSLPDFWKRYRFPHALLQASRWIYPAWERSLRPTYLIRQAASLPPLLLIHSSADTLTPPEYGDRIEHAAQGRGRVERVVVDGAEHTHAFRDARDVYIEKVMTFLQSLNQNGTQR